MHLASWGSSGLGSLPRAKVAPSPHTQEWDQQAGREQGLHPGGCRGPRASVERGRGVLTRTPAQGLWQWSQGTGVAPLPASRKVFIGVVSASLGSKVSRTKGALCRTSKAPSGREWAQDEPGSPHTAVPRAVETQVRRRKDWAPS